MLRCTEVSQYLSLSGFPQDISYKQRVSNLDPFEDYLLERWEVGFRNVAALCREIREKGPRNTAPSVSLGLRTTVGARSIYTQNKSDTECSYSRAPELGQ